MFRDFVKREADKLLQEMGWMRSMGKWKLPVTQPMANFLSMVDGRTRRINVLQWMMTDGLIEASQGRDELTQLVNKAVVELRRGGPKVTPQGVEQPGRKVVGEVRDVGGNQTFEANIYPVDLFSPVARERLRKESRGLVDLDKPLLNGQTVDEYFAEKYEPKQIRLMGYGGANEIIDVPGINEDLEGYGLAPFKFGGVDGYMEFVERGRGWLDKTQMRSPDDPNDQQGPDLSGGHEERDEENKQMMATFHGGSVTKERRKFATHIMRMQSAFNALAEKIQAGQEAQPPEGMDPAHFKGLVDIIKAGDLLKTVEEQADTKGRANIAKIVGMNIRLINYEAPEHWIDIILDNIKKGLNEPTEIAYYGKSDGKPQFPDEVWNDRDIILEYGMVGGEHMARLSPQVQRVAYEFITSELDRGIIRCRTPWRNIFKPFLKDPSLYGKCKENSKMLASATFNRGVRANPEAFDQLKYVSHVLNQENPTRHITKLDVEPSPFTKDFEEQLLSQGYHWAMPGLEPPEPEKPPKDAPPEVLQKYQQDMARYKLQLKDATATYAAERKAGKPNWDHPTRQQKGANLVYQQGDNIYDVVPVKMGEDGQLRFDAPLETGDPGSGTVRDEKQRAVLMGGSTLNVSQGKGHIPSNPLRYEADWKKLIEELKKGKYGEKGGGGPPYYREDELPCVKTGIKIGFNFAARIPGIREILPAPNSDENKAIDQNEYLSWAIEGLRSLSADPAFKFGYLGDEVKELLGFDREEQMALHKRREAEQDPLKKNAMAHGKGIYVLLYKHAGIEDPEEQNRIVQQAQEAIAKGADWDALERILPEEVMNAIGENAFMARVRAIYKMISKRAGDIWTKFKKTGTISGEVLSGDQESGEGRTAHWTDVAQEKGLQGKGGKDWQQYRKDVAATTQHTDSDIMRPMSPEEKRKWAGITGSMVTTATPGPAPEAKPSPAMGQPKPKPPATPVATTGLAPRRPAKPGGGGGLGKYLQQLKQGGDQGGGDTSGLAPRRHMQKESRFISWKEYTSAVYDPKVKVKDGCGFNWWGAAGDPLGVSITGDPIKKGNHGRKRKSARGQEK